MPKTVHFEIILNGQKAGYAKGYAELSKQLTKHKLKGVSNQRLRTVQFPLSKPFNGGDNITINKVLPPSNFKNPLGKSNQTTTVNGSKTVISIKRNKRTELRKFLSEARTTGIFYDIQNRLKNVDKNKNVFNIILNIQTPEGSKSFATKFAEFNSLNNNLENVIQKILETYETELKFEGLNIQYFERKELSKSFVFGCKETDKMKRELYDKLYTEQPKKTFLKFVNKYDIIAPSSYTQCVSRACLLCIGVADNKITKTLDYWNSEKVEDGIGYKWMDNEMNLEQKLSFISSKLNKTITVYDNQLNVELVVEPPQVGGGDISILVHASHSFALLPKKTKFNLTLFEKNQSFQKPMEYSDEVDKPTKKKPKLIHWGAYDFETYVDMNEDSTKRTSDVRPYAVGWTHNINGDYKENYQHLYHDGNITMEFIKNLSNIKIDEDYSNELLLYAHNGGKFDAYEVLYKIISSNINVVKSLIKDGQSSSFQSN